LRFGFQHPSEERCVWFVDGLQVEVHRSGEEPEGTTSTCKQHRLQVRVSYASLLPPRDSSLSFFLGGTWSLFRYNHMNNASDEWSRHAVISPTCPNEIRCPYRQTRIHACLHACMGARQSKSSALHRSARSQWKHAQRTTVLVSASWDTKPVARFSFFSFLPIGQFHRRCMHALQTIRHA
jgi:hypothetical protein